MEALLQKMDKLVEEKIREEVSSYSESYKASQWFKEPTFEDVVGNNIARRADELRKALCSNNKVGLQTAIKDLEIAARDYGKSFYDEDLQCYRTGYEYECMLCTELRNIAANALGLPSTDFHDYYENYSR